MEKSELLNILYAERQRLSDKKNNIGWSLWILIGCLISLGWMTLEYYNTYYFNSESGFNWKQIIILTGDFCILLLGISCFKNFINENRTKYHLNRFSKSQFSTPIILELFVSIIFVAYTIYIYLNTKNNSYISFLFFLSIFTVTKFIEMCQFYFVRQNIPWAWRYGISGGVAISSIITSCLLLFSHQEFYIVNTKFALLLSGILSVLYLLIYYLNNPQKDIILKIDDIIDTLITVNKIDIEKTYNQFIEAKLGYKYGQLFNEEFNNIKHLQLKLERLMSKALSFMDDLENKNVDCELYKEFCQITKEINNIEMKILLLTSTINQRIRKASGILVQNDENIEEVENLTRFIEQVTAKSKSDVKMIKELVERSLQYTQNYELTCRYASKPILCFYVRKKHLINKLYKKYYDKIFIPKA